MAEDDDTTAAVGRADGPFFRSLQAAIPQGVEKGPVARRRPKVAREAYSLYVTLTAEGANEANGPLSASC